MSVNTLANEATQLDEWKKTAERAIEEIRTLSNPEHYSDPTTPLVSYILGQKLKPIFQSNPNPLLNVSTGRRLSRVAGGPMATQDFYDDQTWKSSPGISNLVSWCVRHLPVCFPHRLNGLFQSSTPLTRETLTRTCGTLLYLLS